MEANMQLGDYIKVITHEGNKVCFIDRIDKKSVHFKNQKFGLEVPKERIIPLIKTWRRAKYQYVSFN